MKANIDPSLEALTERIIGCAFTVARVLGHGFLEAVYKSALAKEFISAGLRIEQEKHYPVYYRGVGIGKYITDIVVGESVIVELKAVEKLNKHHIAQVLNYLKASQKPIGLLLNFGSPSLEIRRVLL